MITLMSKLTLLATISAASPCEGVMIAERSSPVAWDRHQASIESIVAPLATQGLRFVDDLERTVHEGATRDDAGIITPCGTLTLIAAESNTATLEIRDLQGTLIAEHSLANESIAKSVNQPPLNLKSALRKLGDELAQQMRTEDPDALYRSWAVFPFTSAKDNDLGQLVAGELQLVFIRDYRAQLIERSQVGRVAEEYAMQWSGLAEEKVAQDAGALLGADYLVVGEVTAAGPIYRVSARVVRVRDGRVMTGSGVDLAASDLVALSAESVVLKSKSGAFFRSLLIPGWGQSYNLEPTKAWIFGGLEAVTAGAAIWSQLNYQNKKDAYDSLGVGGSFKQAADDADRAYALRNSLLLGVALIHLANVVDAYLSGTDATSASASVDLESNTAMLAWNW